MRSVTLILPYYINAGMLVKQVETINAYPAEVLRHLELIVVDDGSPKDPARFEITPACTHSLYRCKVDIRWNWLFCRNLGAHKAAGDWLMLTDIDHLVPGSTMRYLMTGEFKINCVYRFSRVSAPDMQPYKPHPNSWFMTKELYHRIGGYDERFSGYYGSDGDFRDRVRKKASDVVMLPQTIIRVGREVIPDASTTTYQRKAPQDGEAVPRIRRERDASGDQRPKNLLQPYEKLV